MTKPPFCETEFRALADGAFDKLRRIVSVNSGTFNAEGVRENARIISGWFEALGFEPRLVPSGVEGCAEHLMLTRRGSGEKSVVFVSHLDTVYTPEEERKNKFVFREEGGRISGPGVADIKGGTVLVYWVLAALAAGDRTRFERTTWHVLINATEEIGSKTFEQAALECFTPQTAACLVFEAGRERPELGAGASSFVFARNAVSRFIVETFGRQAHSGADHARGASAIRELARIIERVESWTDYARELTFSFGKISGGIAVNCVPDYARAELDMRAKNWDDYRDGLARVSALQGAGGVAAVSDGFKTSVRIENLQGYPPWPENPASAKLAEAFIDCGRLLGLKIVALRERAASDGSVFYEHAPTIDGVGPVGANIHSAEHNPAGGKFQESALKQSFFDRGLANLLLLGRLV